MHFKRTHIQKSLSLLVGLMLLVILPVGIVAQSQTLADSDDFLEVSAPNANATVSGSISTRFQVYDDDQSQVPYELRLYTSNCITNVGLIQLGNAPSNQSNNFTINWSTSGPIQGASSINDGQYCMQLCVSLENSSEPYSACNLRFITIRNNNSNPNITSNPPADKSIGRNESWSYDVQASDADGDSLVYQFATAPGFLSINSVNGLIQTNSNNKQPGTYTVTVRVRDNFGGLDSQSFQLTVTQPQQPDPDPEPEPEPPVADPESELVFNFPSEDAVLGGDSNLVEWAIDGDTDRITSIDVEYSSADEEDWKLIASDVDPDATAFTWDTTELENGDYRLRVIVTYDDDSQEVFTSEVFTINNNGSGDNPMSVPLVINVSPQNGEIINEARPVLTGAFTPSVDAIIDMTSFLISVNGTQLEDSCEVNTERFTCSLSEDLENGNHQIRVNVSDTSDQVAELAWTFTVDVPTDEDPEPGVDVPSDGSETPTDQEPGQDIELASSTLSLIGLICLIAAVLIIIPWVLYVMWRNRNSESEQAYASYDAGNVTVNYDQPEEIDPGQFTSYEDYFAAATTSSSSPETTESAPATVVNFYDSPDAIDPYASTASSSDTSASGGVTTPDYTDFYTDTTPDEPTDSTVNDAEGSTPSWLNPVDSGSKGGDPLAPAKEESETNKA